VYYGLRLSRYVGSDVCQPRIIDDVNNFGHYLLDRIKPRLVVEFSE